MRLIHWLQELIFPPKCILCRKVLQPEEMDLCHECRTEQEVFPYGRQNPEPESIYRPQFLDSLTAVWYYGGNVRRSIGRYKFQRQVHLSKPFARFLAMKLLEQGMDGIDLITWVPVHMLRRLERGFDQSQLLAEAVGAELHIDSVRLLKKRRYNRRQSGLRDASARKANVMGAYRIAAPERVRNKAILLLDDVHTTGNTSEECARMLKLAGAREVHFAAVAAAHKQKHTLNKNR